MTDRDEKGRFAAVSKNELSTEMEELLGRYLHSLRAQKDPKESTIVTREREAGYWLAYCERNDIDPLAATTPDVRGYIQSITNLADTTVDSYYRSVQSFYSVVEKDQADDELVLVNGHPCDRSSSISLKDDYKIHSNTSEYQRQHARSTTDIDGARDNDKILALRPEKVQQLFKNVPGKTPETRLRNEIATRLNWYTGCRSIELEGMEIGSIDWDTCSIEVASAKLNVGEHPDLVNRNVYFPEEFKFQLRRWVERVRHRFSAAVEPEGGKILCTTHSDRMDRQQINDVVKQAAHNAGVQRPLRPANPGAGEEIEEWFVTTHRIRRSAISHWVNDIDELDLHQVQRIAGHAKIQQTMDYVEPDDHGIGEDYQRGMG